MSVDIIPNQDFDALFGLKQIRDMMSSGALNQNTLWRGKDGNFFVRRTPKTIVSSILVDLEREYQEIGFLQRGGQYRFRSPQEQYDFMKRAMDVGLPVVSPAYYEQGETTFIPYISGVSYDVFLATRPKSTSKIVPKYLESITDAHNRDIIYSDRWGPNTMIDRKMNLIHIDFDIALEGRNALEFEMSQALYYSIYFAKNKQSSLSATIDFLHQTDLSLYELSTLIAFLAGHANFFANGIYGGIQKEISTLVSSLRNE